MAAKSLGIAPLVVLGLALAADAQQTRGVLTKVDAQKKQIEVETRGRRVRRASMMFEVAPDAKIVVAGAAADLSALQPGDRVVVSFSENDGRLTATAISSRALRLAAANPPAGEAVKGTLARLDAKQRQIIIMSPDPNGDGESEVKLVVSENARISRNQEPVSLEDLKEGDPIVARLEKRGEGTAAVDIQAGKVATAAEGPNARIERIRQILKGIDQLLQQREQKK